jgi:hypothetical protein
MCLVLKRTAKKPKVAGRDIPVVKFLFENEDGTGRSPYQDHDYELDRTTRVDRRDWAKTVKDAKEQIELHRGLHSMGPNSALLMPFGTVAFRAYIPKGAKYYVGSFTGMGVSYISNKLRVTSKRLDK